jgi:hypothetical protein
MPDRHTEHADVTPMFLPSTRCERCGTRPPRYTVGEQEICRWWCTKQLGIVACASSGRECWYGAFLDVTVEIGTPRSAFGDRTFRTSPGSQQSRATGNPARRIRRPALSEGPDAVPITVLSTFRCRVPQGNLNAL